ncbi:MAG: PAS domain S-box protein [Verrucomicrobiota bacterium]
MPPPLTHNEDARLEALHSYNILDTAPEENFDELTRLAAQLCETPIALISFADRDRVWFKSKVGLDYHEVPLHGSFCALAVNQRVLVVIEDAAAHPDFAQHPAVIGGPKFRFYAGAPLINREGYCLGTLCVLDYQPRQLSPARQDALRILSHQVMTQLDYQLMNHELAETVQDYHHTWEALSDSEAFYHSLVESLPQHLFRKDREGRFTYANQRFCHILGRPFDEIKGKTDFDFFPHELALKYQRDDLRVMETRETLDTIEANQVKEGKKYVHTIKTATLDANGNVVGIQGIFWDVTERKRTEEQLGLERDLMRTLLQNLPDRIYFKDVESRFLLCNDAMAARLGLKDPNEAIGKTDFDFHPREKAEEFFQDEQRIILTGQPLINKRERQLDLDGREIWALVTKVPIYNPGGGVRGLIGISHNITQLMAAEQKLREAEEKYRTIFERAVEGIFQTTPDGHFLSANPALARFYGYDSVEDLLAALTDIEHQLYVDASRRDEFIRLMREHGTVSAFESEVFRKDRSTIWISENARTVTDSQGNVLYYEGSVEEITVRKQAEFERERARQAALESANAKAQFLANVSHEIRTPMNGVISMTGLLLKTRLDGEQREYADTIRNSASTLLELINNLLDFSKVEAGKLELEKIPFNIRDSVESTVDLVAERAQAKNLELVWQVEDQVPEFVTGDPGRIRQILLNLVANAVKFTDRGEVCVHLSQQARQADQVLLRFAVTDTGIGISPEVRPRIFQSFVQADGSTTRRYGGTGLGLSICKQLVELMGGHIDLESTPGQGSVFWFTILLEVTPAEQIPARLTPNPQPLEGMQALVVDDHPTSRRVLEQILHRWHLGVEFATNQSETIQRLAERKAAGKSFDFIILDSRLGDTTGLALARHLKAGALAGSAKIILLEIMGRHHEWELLESGEIRAWLFKPVKPLRLLECLVGLAAGRLERWHPTNEGSLTLSETMTRNIRVLLAEDNPVNQKVGLRLLQKIGLHADVVANGFEVLEALTRIPYDIIFLDCHMPEMDGYTAAQEIQKLWRDPGSAPPLKSKPFIIALTANVLPGERERCLASGMDDYLSKPLEPGELIAALGRAGLSLASPAPAPVAGTTPADHQGLLDQAVLDKLRALRQPGETDPMAELIDLFLHDMPRHMKQMQAALANQDAKAMKLAAHSLKGSARNMGVLRLAQTCDLLEQQSREGNLANASQLLTQIQAEYAEAEQALLAEKGK